MMRIFFVLLVLLTAPAALAGEAPPRAEPIPNAERTFQEVMELIRTDYVDADLTEDALWTAAIDGLLARLHQGEKRPVNLLMDPRQSSDLKVGIDGSVTGIGIMIKEGIVFVLRSLPGGGAEEAGITSGDRILAIDDAPVKGMDLGQIAHAIRGPAKTEVKLLMQRDTDEWTVRVTRAPVVLPAVEGQMVDDRTGLLQIRHFSASTTKQLGQTLAELRKDGAEQLILDLRGCPGGLLEPAMEAAQVFLPHGKTIVQLQWRTKDDEVLTSEGNGSWAEVPLAILVDERTASGAEILAAALRENGRGRILGAPTFGKGTVERLYSLDAGWSLKLSTARFTSPDGNSWQAVGIIPDIAVTADEASETATESGDLDADVHIRAALTVLGLGG